jgi:hypothetical protein
MHAACLEAEVPGSVSKFESVQGATIACVTPRTRSDSVRFAHLHAQRLMTLCISVSRSLHLRKRGDHRDNCGWKHHDFDADTQRQRESRRKKLEPRKLCVPGHHVHYHRGRQKAWLTYCRHELDGRFRIHLERHTPLQNTAWCRVVRPLSVGKCENIRVRFRTSPKF